MAKIYNVQDLLAVKKDMTIKNPISKNGAYFMKFIVSKTQSPIYFQAPKCTVKQAFTKSGQKKMYCDFAFSNDDDDVFLEWLDQLEEATRSILFENREKWFETALEEEDIENSMMPLYKMDKKARKSFLLRANVPVTNLGGKCDLKVYNEDQEEIDPDTVSEGMQCLVIFEFKGIRCSLRNFQFEVELKQMLLVRQRSMFETCLLSKGTTTTTPLVTTIPTTATPLQVTAPNNNNNDEDSNPHAHINNTNINNNTNNNNKSIEENEATVVEEDSEQKQKQKQEEDKTDTNGQQTSSLGEQMATPASTFSVSSTSSTSLLEEITDLPILEEEGEEEEGEGKGEGEMPKKEDGGLPSSSSSTIQLKSKNDIYYKMYKEARAVAKEAKMIALTNYLEAKRIKNLYLLEDMSESDDDDDDMDDINNKIENIL